MLQTKKQKKKLKKLKCHTGTHKGRNCFIFTLFGMFTAGNENAMDGTPRTLVRHGIRVAVSDRMPISSVAAYDQ